MLCYFYVMFFYVEYSLKICYDISKIKNRLFMWPRKTHTKNTELHNLLRSLLFIWRRDIWIARGICRGRIFSFVLYSPQLSMFGQIAAAMQTVSYFFGGGSGGSTLYCQNCGILFSWGGGSGGSGGSILYSQKLWDDLTPQCAPPPPGRRLETSGGGRPSGAAAVAPPWSASSGDRSGQQQSDRTIKQINKTKSSEK